MQTRNTGPQGAFTNTGSQAPLQTGCITSGLLKRSRGVRVAWLWVQGAPHAPRPMPRAVRWEPEVSEGCHTSQPGGAWGSTRPWQEGAFTTSLGYFYALSRGKQGIWEAVSRGSHLYFRKISLEVRGQPGGGGMGTERCGQVETLRPLPGSLTSALLPLGL